MLTGFQTEVVAYRDENGGIYHADNGGITTDENGRLVDYEESCAVQRFGSYAVSRAETGLWNEPGLEAVIRYSLSEVNGADTWDAARERLADFADDHPEVAHELGVVPSSGSWERNDATGYGRWVYPEGSRNYERAVERLADKRPVYQTCDFCGQGIED